MLPTTVIYDRDHREPFNLDSFKEFVQSYGDYDKEIMTKELEECAKFPMIHVSRLVRCAIISLKDKKAAKKCYEENWNPGEGFERLRRITGSSK
ncbi:hypothetical protein IJG14_01645 [bacterium]|nr:hypothetical protein [bacterium]